MEMPDQEDHQTFDDIVDAYYQRVFRGALSVTGDKHLAEEIVQETFLSAFRKFGTFSGKSSVFRWLYAIMLNKHRDHCRKIKLLKRLGLGRTGAEHDRTKSVKSGGPSPYAELAKSEKSQLLRKAVYKLPVKLREVVAMHYFDELSLSEVAEILDCNLETVKSRLFRSRKRLRQTLRGKLS
jgi:RNA polymerase sigma factor (sigma-70 family)